ncbi:hypothetical protein Tsubulata_020649 [Turnera subulata]|uniref:FAS1 domain-containing protein n=1 Tax=Turnera subulata TaxID=218843 RepID=A0A9Q0GFZ2_9ROSI|nr:hypothetical protein Tsubulata_020649 [Turnera subulata]
MDFCCLFILVSLFAATESQSTNHSSTRTDMETAIADMRSQSFYGFAILLQMVRDTFRQYQQDLTFFMPIDQELSKGSVSADHLQSFMLSHSVMKPLSFSDLNHFPSGTMVPSGLRNRLIKIQNHGAQNFSVNNALVITPNVCLNTAIKCHGINAVLKFGNDSD